MTANTWMAHRIARTAGRGGHVSYEVHAESATGGAAHLVFDGSIFGGPVALAHRDGGRWGHRETVEESRHYGEFATAQWVRRFLQTWCHETTDARATEATPE